MRKLIRASVIGLTIALAAGLYSVPLIVAQSRPEGIVRSPEMATAAAIVAYWTPQRMASAIPRVINPGTPSARAGRVLAPTGPATFVRGNEPGEAPGSLTRLTGAAAPQDAKPLGYEAFSYPYPFSRQQVFPIAFFRAGYTRYPFSNNGKLFFTLGTTDYVCSATSLTSGGGNQSLILTAGHCVSSGAGAWATNVLFSPGHRDNTTPPDFAYSAGSARWPAHQLFTTTEWFNDGNLKRDFAMVVLRRKVSDGTPLGNIIGTQGLAWDFPEIQHYHSLGYPAATLSVWPFTPFNGQRQWSCQSSYARRVTEYNPSAPGPAPIAIGCDMTGGCSGGGWIMGFNDGWTTGYEANGGYLNSVNSFRWISPSQPRALHGPYFDSAVGTMWNTARVVVVPWP